MSAKLLDQFVECFETTVLADDAPLPVKPSEALRKIEAPEAKPVDLLDAAGSPVAKRVGPILAVVALVWLLKKLLARRR